MHQASSLYPHLVWPLAFKTRSKTEEVPFRHSEVDGMILPPFMVEEQVRTCTQFQTSPGDIFLVTYPKAGTTWLSEIIRRIAQPKGSEKEKLLGGPIPVFDIATQEQLEAVPSPRYMSSKAWRELSYYIEPSQRCLICLALLPPPYTYLLENERSFMPSPIATIQRSRRP